MNDFSLKDVLMRPSMVMEALQDAQREERFQRARAEKFKHALESMVEATTQKELEGMAAYMRAKTRTTATGCLEAVEALLSEFPNEKA